MKQINLTKTLWNFTIKPCKVILKSINNNLLLFIELGFNTFIWSIFILLWYILYHDKNNILLGVVFIIVLIFNVFYSIFSFIFMIFDEEFLLTIMVESIINKIKENIEYNIIEIESDPIIRQIEEKTITSEINDFKDGSLQPYMWMKEN